MKNNAFKLLVTGGLLAAASAWAAPFAMVTDLKGDAWAIQGGQQKKLTLLGYIESPTEIKVDGQGKVSVTYFSNGVQYNFAGPSRVALESAAPKVIEGTAVDAKKVTPEKAIGGGSLNSDQWRRLQQATVVMRNVKSTFSVVGPDKTAVLATTPEFEWTPAQGAKSYRVVVYGAKNEVIHESTTEQNSVKLSSLELQPGQRYRWKVDALGVSKPVSTNGAFIVASDAERQRMASLKPTGNDLGARSFYATLLEAEGHAHDARAEWKALAREYPNEPEIAQRGR
jgi:hypothetical protein